MRKRVPPAETEYYIASLEPMLSHGHAEPIKEDPMPIEARHPHPHIDPRQPRDGSRPGTTPPVFAWKPLREGGRFELVVARDSTLTDIVLHVQGLTEPTYLPEKALHVGVYYWCWSVGNKRAPTFSFEITADALYVLGRV